MRELPQTELGHFIHAGEVVFREDPAWVKPLNMMIGDRLNPKKDPFYRHADVVLTGWIVVEQDRILRDDEPLDEAVEAQIRNRQWLRTHPGL